MKLPKSVSSLGPKRRRSHSSKLFPILALVCAAVFIGSAFVVTDCRERLSALGRLNFFGVGSRKCEERPIGTEALPRSIVSSTSDLEMRPLWGTPTKKTT